VKSYEQEDLTVHLASEHEILPKKLKEMEFKQLPRFRDFDGNIFAAKTHEDEDDELAK
jgi:hypothetical protein